MAFITCGSTNGYTSSLSRPALKMVNMNSSVFRETRTLVASEFCTLVPV